VQIAEISSVQDNCKLLTESSLQQFWGNGGGGIRTPVPRRFKTSFYTLSYFFKSRLNKRQATGFHISQVRRFRSTKPNKSVKLSHILTPLQSW